MASGARTSVGGSPEAGRPPAVATDSPGVSLEALEATMEAPAVSFSEVASLWVLNRCLCPVCIRSTARDGEPQPGPASSGYAVGIALSTQQSDASAASSVQVVEALRVQPADLFAGLLADIRAGSQMLGALWPFAVPVRVVAGEHDEVGAEHVDHAGQD